MPRTPPSPPPSPPSGRATVDGGHGLAGAVLAVALMAAASAVSPTARAGDAALTVAGASLHVPLQSFVERRFHGVVRQRYDFSCGSAALATLLTHHYDRPTSEEAAFRVMWERGDQAEIRRLGFSLLDMKGYLESLGIGADGFEVTLDQIAEVGVPVITLIETSGYKHFVVVKGIRDGQVLLGDPARGVAVMPRATFEPMWNGIIFAIRDGAPTARQGFNRDQDWPARPPAPFGTALDRQSLASFTVLLRGPNDH